LIALDFPTFERPAKAISGRSSGGRPPLGPAEVRNSTLENALMDAGMGEILIK
jgi:hypothetical protein